MPRCVEEDWRIADAYWGSPSADMRSATFDPARLAAIRREVLQRARPSISPQEPHRDARLGCAKFRFFRLFVAALPNLVEQCGATVRRDGSAVLSIEIAGRVGQNSGMRWGSLVTLATCLLLGSVSIGAQPRTDEHMARARTPLAVRLLPDLERRPLATLPAGTIVKVIRRDGAWINIEFRDARYGERTGYVLASALIFDARFVEPPDSTTQRESCRAREA